MNDIIDGNVAPDLRPKNEESDNDVRVILPPNCVVTPLGFYGQKQFFLDHACQLLELTPRTMGKGELVALFGNKRRLESIWPKKRQDKNDGTWDVIDFDQSAAQFDLIEECSNRGIFDPTGRLFGRGAHRDPTDGALIFHLGNRVLQIGGTDKKGKQSVDIKDHKPGFVNGKIYPAKPKIPAPAMVQSQPEDAKALLKLFQEWEFVEPEAAPLLILGYVAQGFICGALPWRSHVWLTGETSAGKSTLQTLLRKILGDFGLYTEDATEAGIRQVLNDDTLPVLIDEAEGDDEPDRQKKIVNLVRKASSGSKMHRGSSDHSAKEFTVFSAFLFSSILHSPLDPQDQNRMAILKMKTIPSDRDELEIDYEHWREIGSQFQRRMIEQWPRFEKTLADYQREIQSHGFQGRWRKTFGTLLACADMLLYDSAPRDADINSDEVQNEDFREKRWVRSILPLMHKGRIDAEDTTQLCIVHLTSSLLPAQSGYSQETVGTWINKAKASATDPDNDGAMRKLRNHGLRLVTLTETKSGGIGCGNPEPYKPIYVAIAYQTNVSVKALFKGSKWYGGGWVQALALVDGAHSGIKVVFTGKPDNAILVPIEELLGDGKD